MAVYTIADLHLSFGVDKPMDVFRGWENYTDRIRDNWTRLVEQDDTVVIAGDISWAMTLEETAEDFAFINALPGKKLIVKGNHDYWWTTKAKMDRFLRESGFDSMEIMHNNYFIRDGLALCGSRGWFYDAQTDADMKVLNREAGRLRTSLQGAVREGYTPVAFLHYPPIYNGMECHEITDVLHEFGVQLCFYGHIHGGSAAKRAFEGEHDGILYRLIACDHIGFTPLHVL